VKHISVISLAAMLLLCFCDEPTPAPDLDVSVTSIDEPSGDIGFGSSITPAASIENRGDTAATFDVWMLLEDPTDATAYRDSLMGQQLAAGASDQFAFAESDPLATAGAWAARCSTWFSGDMDSTNNVLTRQFTVGAPKDVVDLIPADNEISGWNRNGSMRIAENETQLYDLINGEAVLYLDNGFEKTAFQDFLGQLSGNDVDLELRVFDQGDAAGAAGVYAATASGAETPWTENSPGTAARIDESLLFSYKVEFHYQEFFVWITIMEKSDAALNVAKLFALNVAGAIEE
jgi:hypothetical protein